MAPPEKFYRPLVDIGRWLLARIPRDMRLKYFRLNFIVVHYLYMICMGLVGSIILYGNGFIPYIDALFFAVGAATQSGLNTINVNDLLLYQQVTCYFIACVANPIFINTVVVFVRLYWFEKRFEHVVKEIRDQRRSRAKTITRTKSEMREDASASQLERGVNGRQIKVLHETTKPNGMSGTKAGRKDEEREFLEKMGLQTHAQSVEPTPAGSNTSSGGAEDDTGHGPPNDQEVDPKSTEEHSPVEQFHLGLHPRLNREITFADEVGGKEDETPELAKVPDRADMSKHIEFIQRQQRNAREGSTLWIPGPRDFDRGEVPEEVDSSDQEELQQVRTRDTLQPSPNGSEHGEVDIDEAGDPSADDHTQRNAIKFDEQEHPGRRQDTTPLESDPTHNSKFGLERIKSGFGTKVRHRRSNSHLLNLHNPKSTIGRTFTSLTTVRSRDVADPMPYLSWQATTGRNSAFVNLSEEQREELGGIEYRSLKTLAKTLLIYFFGFHILGVIIFTPWILETLRWRRIVTAVSQNPTWWGIFTSASLFNDLGLTLTPDSMLSFQQAVVPLLIGAILIIIGNTGFPVMLRFVIWLASKFIPYGSATWEELQFLLDHPRRCFTLLFPSKATWWLFWILVILNGVDLIFFIILDLNDPTVMMIPTGYRILDGFFQAASTRTAGFACVNLADLHPAIQVSYMVMMYISVFPIAISVRRTNVYEEKSLGVFGGEELGDEGSDPSYVGQHLRRQLSFDLWYIFLGFFIISIVEGDRLGNSKDVAFTLFSVLFEIVSAYGTVGLSLGYTGIDASFSAEFRPLSKLIIIAMMLRGRHRGLPYALDRSILLPSEKLQKKEAEEMMRPRRGSIFAESNEAELLRHGATWSETDIDAHGLPRQHTVDGFNSHGAAMTAGAGGIAVSPERARTVRRRGSGFSTASANPRRARSMSLSRVIAGGLSAGPTNPKRD